MGERGRQEMMQANEYQKNLKVQRKQKEAAEEEDFRRRMAEKYAEDERIDRANKQRRADMQKQFVNEVDQLADYKKQQYIAQQEQEMREQRVRDDEESERARIIEEERKRMLIEHASRLLEHLPKGVLQKPEDLDMLIDLLNERMG